MGKNDIFLITPSEECYYIADNADPWHYYWLGFNGTQARTLLKKAGFIDNNVFTKTVSDNDLNYLTNLIEQILLYPPGNKETRYVLQGYLFLYLGKLISLNEADIKYDAVTDSALEYIHNHYFENIVLEDLAKKLNYSRATLYRNFKRHTGFSPKGYILEYRLNKAMCMITEKEKTLKEVSEFCGFENYTYFTTAFRKKFGKNPKQARDALFNLKGNRN